MSANPPHPSGPGEPSPRDRAEADGNALSGGAHGILSVTLATLALALTAAAVAAVVAWVI